MKFLKSDLPRNFAIGFITGALVIAFQMNPELSDQLIPQAIAASVG